MHMPRSLTELAQDAADLPGKDKLKLARILLELSDSDSAPAAHIEEAGEEEIARRLQELLSGKARGVPLDEVRRPSHA
jgi:hypothetical protein